MNKKIIGLMSGLLILSSFSGCGKKENSNTTSSINSISNSSSFNSSINEDKIYIEYEKDTSELDGELKFGDPVSYSFEEIKEAFGSFNEIYDDDDIRYFCDKFNLYCGPAGIDVKYIKAFLDTALFQWPSNETIEIEITNFSENIKTLLFELSEDQLVSMLNSMIATTNRIELRMPYSLEKLSKIQTYAESIGRSDIAKHFKNIESYYDLFEVNKELSDEDRKYTEQTIILIKGVIRIAREFIARLTNNEIKFIISSLFSYRGYRIPKSILPTYEANIINIINKLGRALKNIPLSDNSFKTFFDNIYLVLKDNSLSNGDLVYVAFNESQEEAYKRIKSFVTGEEVHAFINLVGTILEKVTQDDVETFMNGQSLFNTLQVFDKVSFLNKVMNGLSSTDKKSLKSLSNKLGFDFEELVEKLIKLDINDQNNLNDISTYLNPVINNVNDIFLFPANGYNYGSVSGSNVNYNSLADYDIYQLNSDSQPTYDSYNFDEGTYTYEFKDFDTSKIGKHTIDLIVTYNGEEIKYEYTYLVVEDFILEMTFGYSNALNYIEKYIYGNKQYFELNSTSSYYIKNCNMLFNPYESSNNNEDMEMRDDFIGLDTSYVHDGYFFIEFEGLYYAVEYYVYDPSNVEERISCERYYHIQNNQSQTEILRITKNYIFANGEEVEVEEQYVDVEINCETLGKHSMVIDCFNGEKYTYEYEVVALEDCRYGGGFSASIKNYVSSLDEVVIEVDMDIEYYDGEEWCYAGYVTLIFDSSKIVFEKDEYGSNSYTAYIYLGKNWCWYDYSVYIVDEWKVDELNEYLGFEVKNPNYYYSNVDIEVNENDATLSFDSNMSGWSIESYIQNSLNGIRTYEYDENGNEIFCIEDSNIMITYKYGDNRVIIHFEEVDYGYSKGWRPEQIKEFLGFELKEPDNYEYSYFEYGETNASLLIGGMSEDEVISYFNEIGLAYVGSGDTYLQYCFEDNNELEVKVGIGRYVGGVCEVSINFYKICNINEIENNYDVEINYYNDDAFLIETTSFSITYYVESLDGYDAFIEEFFKNNNIIEKDANGKTIYVFEDNQDVRVEIISYNSEEYEGYSEIVIFFSTYRYETVVPEVDFIECQSGDLIVDQQVEYDENNQWISIISGYQNVTSEEYEQYLLDLENTGINIISEGIAENPNCIFVFYTYSDDTIGTYMIEYYQDDEVLVIGYLNNDYWF